MREPGMEPDQIVPKKPALTLMSAVDGQIDDALRVLERDDDAFVAWPFDALHDQVGGMAPGDVWYLCAFSGGGKTTFLLSAIDRWASQGYRVFVMPLETRAKDWRVRWACHQLGINAGDVMNGAYLDWPNADEVRAQIRGALKRQGGLAGENVWVDAVEEVTAAELAKAVQYAAEWKADIVVVDHIDHIQADEGTNLYAESVKANKLALSLAQQYGIRLVLSSQLNLSIAKASGGDKLAKYAPPQVDHIYMGGHKIHVATGMIGLFRPLREREAGEVPYVEGSRRVDPYVEAIKAARAGTAEPWTVLKPHTMGVVTMKLRNQSNDKQKPRYEGQRCELGVEQGRVVDIAEKDRHKTTRI